MRAHWRWSFSFPIISFCVLLEWIVGTGNNISGVFCLDGPQKQIRRLLLAKGSKAAG